MKILHIVPSYKPAYIYGGPIVSVARLCEGLAEAGNTVHVYTTTANGNTELEVMPGTTLDVDGVQVTYFKRITKDPTHVSPALWKQLNKKVKEYDVVHIHSWWNILVIVAAWICHINHVKVVVSPRGMLSTYIMTATHSFTKQLIHRFAGKKALAKAVFHATAASEYQECKRLIPGWKGFLVPNILSLPEVTVVRNKNKAFTLLFLSRIHPKKGIELLFEAIQGISFPIVLRLAGTGDEAYIASLKAKADALNITDKIQWMGWKGPQEKFQELMQADLFVLTSFNENFANVVIESLHVGTPVLVSEEVGLASFVEDHKLGWVTPLTANDIKQTLIEVYTNIEEQQHTHREGKKIIANQFAPNILIKRYEEEYLHISNQTMQII